ncbi:MAG: CooT family nickel-binding protein [Methanohalobium sp.]|uniref:CooT family nickel-binding protein n=1 Tax=Methanohalobium sp. TaxID=2837493 RepID=UPI003978BCB1
MCELNAVLVTGNERQLIMESVTRMVNNDGKIELTGIFGDKKYVTGFIKEVDFSKGETIITQNS